MTVFSHYHSMSYVLSTAAKEMRLSHRHGRFEKMQRCREVFDDVSVLGFCINAREVQIRGITEITAEF